MWWGCVGFCRLELALQRLLQSHAAFMAFDHTRVRRDTTTVCSHTEGVLYMRRAIRFVTAGAPLGRVTGIRPVRSGALLGA